VVLLLAFDLARAHEGVVLRVLDDAAGQGDLGRAVPGDAALLGQLDVGQLVVGIAVGVCFTFGGGAGDAVSAVVLAGETQ